MMPSLVEMAKANDTSKQRKQQHQHPSWVRGAVVLNAAGTLAATAYGLRELHRGRVKRPSKREWNAKYGPP